MVAVQSRLRTVLMLNRSVPIGSQIEIARALWIQKVLKGNDQDRGMGVNQKSALRG